MSIGFADRRLGREERAAAACARCARQLDDLEAGRLAGVGAEDPRTAGVGDDRDAVAARRRLRRQQRGDVEELAERVGADHAGLAEQRVDGDVGGREQRARCATSVARAPAAERPLLTATIGLLRPTRRAIRANFRALPNDSRYSRITSVFASCSQYWRKSLPDRSALLPTETNAESPRSQPVGGVDDRDPEPAALRQEADAARRSAPAA